MSEEFLRFRDLEWTHTCGLFGCREPGEDGWYLPPIRDDGIMELNEDIWAGSAGVKGATFLDNEFIYDPHRFLDMTGSKWSVFRKNTRKWPTRSPGQKVYRRLVKGELEDECGELLVKWVGDGKVFDPEVLLKFGLFGEYRFGLFLDGRLVGLNACDLNWEFTNFRLCVDNGSSFIQEHLRWLFYTSSFVLGRDRFVNDGGNLGSEGLYRFKKKLNPVGVRQVYSFRRK